MKFLVPFKLLLATALIAWFIIVVIASCGKSRVVSNPWDSTASSKDSISFIVVGDWGRFGGEYQQAVANQMNNYAINHSIQFIVTTGDNFYESGVVSTTDPHWKGSFEDIYNKPGQQLPWYVILGNHDYRGNPAAEILYATSSSRWKMPARYYALKKNIDPSTTALLVFTDTSPFVNEYYGAGMSDLERQDTASQIQWITNTLEGSNDEWKLVFGHHPVFSVGAHGNTGELVQRFRPLFIQTATDFYISGHDHSLQQLQDPQSKIEYLVSGAGSESTSVNPDINTHFARAVPGFLVMTLYARKAQYYFYDYKGVLLYRRQVMK